MGWNFGLLNTVFDLFFIGSAATTAWLIYRRRATLTEHGLARDAWLIVTGLALLALFYLADLVIVLGLPIYESRRAVSDAVRALHVHYSAPIMLPAVACIVAGFWLNQRRLLVLIGHIRRSRQALRASEKRYRAVIEDQADLICRILPDTTITFVNNAYCRFLDRNREEIIGRKLWELLPEKDRPIIQESIDSLSSEKLTASHEHRSIGPDGESRWMHWANRAVLDDEGTVSEIQGTGRDISERKQAEQALRESEARLAATGRLAKVGGWEMDAATNEIRWTEESYRIYEYPLDKPPLEAMAFCHPDARPKLETAFLAALEQGEPFELEVRSITAKGNPFCAHLIGTPVIVDGKTVKLTGAVQDISERRRGEEQLRRYESIVSSTTDMLALLDGNYVYLAANAAYLEAFAKTAEELIGRTVAGVFGEAFFDAVIRPRAERCLAGESIRYQDWFEFPETGRRYMDIVYSPYPGNGAEVSGFVVTARDITELKRVEEQLRRAQKMEAIGQLSGGIAHDCNNILAIILGNLELLRPRVANDEAARERVEAAHKAVQRGANLTRQLLGVSRHQPGKAVSSDINRLIGDLENLITHSITPQVELEHRLADGLWSTEVDPGEFEDALLNLIINARDAMGGSGQLTLETGNCALDAQYCALNVGATPGEYVRLTVSDNGNGISDEAREHLFEPFFTTKPKGKGTGLGLAMVFGFVKRCGGHINVYSEPNVGATFRIYLPRAKRREDPAAAVDEQSEDIRGGSETILVVDDEEALLEVARDSLRLLGYRVLTAGDGHQALAWLAETPGIALLFSDVVMPGGINGYELAERATAVQPGIKVLLASGYSDMALASNGQAHFAANLLGKPYTGPELGRRVRALLDGSRAVVTGRDAARQADRRADVAPIEWRDGLSVGVKTIDDDHRELIDIIHGCRSEMQGEDNDQRIRDVLDRLQAYTVEHFAREEVLMDACNYPALNGHRRVHRLLVRQFERMRLEVDEGNLRIAELAAFLANWLIDHIQVMDQAFAPYCQGRAEHIEDALRLAGRSPANGEA